MVGETDKSRDYEFLPCLTACKTSPQQLAVPTVVLLLGVEYLHSMNTIIEVIAYSSMTITFVIWG